MSSKLFLAAFGGVILVILLIIYLHYSSAPPGGPAGPSCTPPAIGSWSTPEGAVQPPAGSSPTCSVDSYGGVVYPNTWGFGGSYAAASAASESSCASACKDMPTCTVWHSGADGSNCRLFTGPPARYQYSDSTDLHFAR